MNNNFKIAAAIYVAGFAAIIADSYIGNGVIVGLIGFAAMAIPTIAYLVRGLDQVERSR